MAEIQLAPRKDWLTEPLPSVVADSIARLQAAEGVKQVAVMPDVHLSREVCVGTVVATEGVVYPQAVGGDIGCGMAALAFDIEADAIDHERAAASLLAGLYEATPTGKHRRRRPLPQSLKPEQLSDPKLSKLALREGAVQLGTLGRGNHFLELQADPSGQLWVMLHSGSRAMGQGVAAHHLAKGEISGSGLIALETETENGSAYLNDVRWARAYAAENRLAMLRAVEEIVHRLVGGSADWDSFIHSDHNHVQQESHNGTIYFIHRKGAQSARAGEAGIIPGSMGTPSFLTTGRGCEESMKSCSHGAGRKMSRTEARRAVTTRDFRRQVGRLWFDHRRTDRLRDESPAAYKDIRRVMRAQQELVKVVWELRPVLSYKGS